MLAATSRAWIREMLCWLVPSQPFQAKHLKINLFFFLYSLTLILGLIFIGLFCLFETEMVSG